MQVLGGLDHGPAEAGPDGAGDHARGNGTFLTGVRLKKSATDIRAGESRSTRPSPDEIGHLTRFPSLELTCDSGAQARALAIPAIRAPTSTTSPGARRRRP